MEALAPNQFKDITLRFIHKNGSLIWIKLYSTISPINKYGNFYNVFAIIDITKEKELEINLKNSKKLFLEIFEFSPIGKYIKFNTGEKKPNKALINLLGYSQEELNSFSVRDFIYDYDLENYDEYLRSIQISNKIYELKVSLKHKKGNKITVILRSIKSPKDEFGNFYYLTSYFDLTEIEKTRQELINKNKDLQQFNYISSHDLQEPLSSIVGFSNLLVEEEYDKIVPIGKKSIEVIKDSALRMKNFINALLEYSIIGREKIKVEVDFINLIENIKIDLNDLITKRNVSIIYINKPLKINAYEANLSRLFQNLISNAIKYNNSDNPEIIIDVKKVKKEYLFSVKDNGIGIDPKHHNKIFDIFRRLHNRDNYSGTGIGLSHCKRVVELHWGKIWVKSELGKGSTFYFTIAR